MAVSPEKLKELNERMARLGVREDDLKETFIRSSGPGGQKVNKTSSCVYLVHLPSGVAVKCQKDRSQTVNRFLARRELLDRLSEAQGGARKSLEREKQRKNKERRLRRRKKKNTQDDHPIPGAPT